MPDIKEEKEQEEAKSSCPMCGGSTTYYVFPEHFEAECHDCGHEFMSK